MKQAKKEEGRRKRGGEKKILYNPPQVCTLKLCDTHGPCMYAKYGKKKTEKKNRDENNHVRQLSKLT